MVRSDLALLPHSTPKKVILSPFIRKMAGVTFLTLPSPFDTNNWFSHEVAYIRGSIKK